MRISQLSVSAISCTVITPLIVLVLAGCSTELTFRRREALDSFVGTDRSHVIERLGTPSQDVAQGSTELLTYDVHVLKWIPGEPGVRDYLGNPEGPWVQNARCSTTFRLASGVVNAWRLDGNDCRQTNFPPLGPNIADALNAANQHGVDNVARFQHNAFTGRSQVSYGVFQSN
jgi:hypothetical protein